MMRPACAYPPFVQTNLQNDPDIYTDRDAFGFGIVCNQNPSVQTVSSASGLYAVTAPGPIEIIGNSSTQQFQTSSAFPGSNYSHVPVQPQFSNQLSAEAMPQGPLPPSFQTQQPTAYQTVITPNGEKLISTNLPSSGAPGYPRGSNLNGLLNQSSSVPAGYGPIVTGPGPNSIISSTSANQQRLPIGTTLASVCTNRNMSHSPMSIRPNCNRPSSGMADANGFSNQQMFTSYNPGTNAPGGVNVQVPYTLSVSNAVAPSTISGMNKSNVPLMTPYNSTQQLIPQNMCGSAHMGRSACCPPGAPSLPQVAGYPSPSPRPANCSTAYITAGYPVQPYASSTSFRGGPNAIPCSQAPTMLQRPLSSQSPQVSKESSGVGGLQLHTTIVQQHSAQLQSGCPSVPSDSPNACSTFPPTPNCKGHGMSTLRSGSNGPAGALFNSGVVTSNVIGPNSSLTPPGNMVLNGPVQQMGQSTVLGTINGCLPMGEDIKLNPGVPDGCYVQSRPMSSSSRDSNLSNLPANGSIGSCSDLLISPTFPVSNNLNTSNIVYAPNQQQIPVLSGDFDAIGSSTPPMMMMTMNSPSPLPGGHIMNGALPAGVMNVALANPTPAPPPYHQTGPLGNCRSMGSSIFFGPSGLPTVSGAAALHSNGLNVLPDNNAAMISDRHYMGVPGDTNVMITGGKQTPGGAKAARPKRTRSTKTTAGSSRGKANSKKANPATPATVSRAPMTGPSPDPFAMNIRMPTQQQMRQRVSPWNMCPSNGNNFPPGMGSPPLLMPVGADNRAGCISPASFSSPSGTTLMRPNSGPPVNSSFAGMAHTGSTTLDSAARASPTRPYCSGQSVPVQHQSYISPGQTPITGPPHFMNQMNHSQLSTSSPVGLQHPPQPQSQSANYPPNTRASTIPFHSQPLSNSQQLQPTPNRLPTQLPPSAAIRGPLPQQVGSEPTSTDKMSGPPYSSPGPPSVASGMAPPISLPGETDRLVCPITNGMVWGPTQIQLKEVMHHFLHGGVHVCRFEFDLTANHLNTIVGRSDLDIVVCSHLLSEPLQVCHWPSDAVQIRFNDYLLRLDRSCVGNGQSAHKVACVKQLCRPGRNQLEIAILGLGEDPNQSATMNKRHAMESLLETHRFAAFMAHMPALNVLLDGLKRRRPAGVNALCDILEGRVGSRSEGGASPARSAPVIAELNLVCPVFRTRMNVPGRIMGCEHVEAFDMEAFLRREVLWPRLNCPICRHKSPAGLDGLCIDTTILNALNLVHPMIESILVRSDGYWRLPPPIALDLPPDVDQWQPVIGPLSEVVTQALSSMAMIKTNETKATHPSPSLNNTTPDWNGAATSPRTGPSKSNRVKVGSVPPPTPNKEGLTSPPWPAWSGSPSVRDKVGGPQSADSGSNDGHINLRPTGGTRPASQPITWHGMQPSPHDHRTTLTPQHVQSPKSTSDLPNTADSTESKFQAPQRQASYSTNNTILATSSDESEGSGKVRRSSTGSTRIAAIGTETIGTLPPVPEHALITKSSPLGSCDSLTTDEKSPNRLHSSTQPASSSVPASPASGSRAMATSCGFSVPSIPGVNMLAMDKPNPTVTSDLCNSQFEPQKMSSTKSDLFTDKTSDSTLTDFVDRNSQFAINKHPDEVDEEKKQPSSLNMGLDFLLSEEHAVNVQSISGDSTQNSKLPPQTQGQNATESFSVKSDEKTNGLGVKAVLNDYLISKTESPTGSYLARNVSSSKDDNLGSADSDQPVKRMKMDPDFAHSGADQPVSDIPKHCQNSSCDSKVFEDEKKGNVFPKDANSPFSEAGKPEGACENEPYTQGAISALTNRLFDERLCNESIHSLSAQIDRIELFLDESYIRFVESFPCN